MRSMGYYIRSVISAMTLGVLSLGTLSAGTLGMVADNTTKSVTVFDADTDTVIGSVFLPQSPTPSSATGDCVITLDQKFGFVTDFQFRVWVIDLEASPPVLASGVNPISVPNRAEDLALTPDGKYLVACDGSNLQPLVLIDIATRMIVASFNTGADCDCVDVCPDGSVLVGSTRQQRIYHLTIDESGPTPVFVPSPNVLSVGGSNVYCAPNGQVGVVVRGPDEIVSFTIPDMTIVDRRPLTGVWGNSGVFGLESTQFFVRSQNFGNLTGFVDVYDIDPTTAALGATPALAFPIAGSPPDVLPNRVSAVFGMDLMALSPAGDKLYVTERDVVTIYDPTTGNILNGITAPQAIVSALGVCIQAAPIIDVLVDIKPESDVNPVNLKSQGLLPIAILSTPDFDALTIDPTTILVGDPLLIANGASAVPSDKDQAEDVNNDGLIDLLIFVKVSELVVAGAIDESTIVLVLTGETTDGDLVVGGDTISIVPGSTKGKGK